MRLLPIPLLMLAGVGSLAAQTGRPRISVGYAYATYLEAGGGSAPVGGYLSVATTKKPGIAFDLAYHRDKESVFGQEFVLNTITAGVGPHAFLGTGTTQPYAHLLFALRHDSFEGASNTSFGGMAGIGVDVPIGGGLMLRTGGDFQMFFDEGGNLKTLRLIAGVAF